MASSHSQCCNAVSKKSVAGKHGLALILFIDAFVHCTDKLQTSATCFRQLQTCTWHDLHGSCSVRAARHQAVVVCAHGSDAVSGFESCLACHCTTTLCRWSRLSSHWACRCCVCSPTLLPPQGTRTEGSCTCKLCERCSMDSQSRGTH